MSLRVLQRYESDGVYRLIVNVVKVAVLLHGFA